MGHGNCETPTELALATALTSKAEQRGYLVHRFVLHDFFSMRHGMHHANPDEPVLTVFRQIWACFALVYFVADGAFLAGALVAYAWYLLVHHSAHHGPDPRRTSASGCPLPA
jgi:hypothetical protein